MQTPFNTTRLINFLKQELALSDQEMSVVLRDPDLGHGPLSILLWKYGLVSIDQLGQIFDWLDDQNSGCPAMQYADVSSHFPVNSTHR